MKNIKEQFYLNKDVTFLNNGSFGACPKVVIKEYQKWQIILENQPVEFLGRKHGERLFESRKVLAEYLGCENDELVFVTNATTAMNIVANSIQLSENDEVLSTNLEYGAMDRMWRLVCERQGAKFISSKINLPLVSEEQFVNDFWKDVTEKTKLISISHITSATALLLPITQIINRAKRNGIITVIDGAHAPGQIPLNLNELGCDFYTGNNHKWLMAPKGNAFFYARKEMQNILKPFLISWGRDEFLSDSTFIDEFEYQGTRDTSSFLSLPAALSFHKKYITKSVKNEINGLLRYVKLELEKIFKTPAIVNEIPENIQMYSHPLPANIDGKDLKFRLYEQFKIEIPVSQQNNVEYIRVSIQIFNNKQDIDYFLNSLNELLR